MRRAAFAVLSVGLQRATVLAARPAASPAAPAKVDFVRDVQPIFAKHCYECHGPDRQSNGLRLDRRKSVSWGAPRWSSGAAAPNRASFTCA